MSRYTVATSKTTGAAAGIIADLRMPSTADGRVFEIGVFAETAVSGTVGLIRATNAGTTPGGAVVPQAEDPSTVASTANLYTTYGTAPTNGGVYMRRIVLPATIGAGVIWTFPTGIVVPVSGGLMLWQISAAAVTYSVYVAYDG